MQRQRSERVFGTMPQWNKEKGVTKTMPNKIIRVGSRESVLAVAQTELVRAAPYLAEKDVVVEFCEFRGEPA